MRDAIGVDPFVEGRAATSGQRDASEGDGEEEVSESRVTREHGISIALRLRCDKEPCAAVGPRASGFGQPVTVRVMGEATVLTGHVQSMAAAIEDRDRAASSNMLPNVNPTFSWVRLAQRVPVRVSLDAVPGGVRLIAGRTASVSVVEAAPAGTRTL